MSLRNSVLQQLCRSLKLPAVAREAGQLAASATRQGLDPLSFLEAVLQLESDERVQRRALRRTKEAGFPLLKTLEGFNFARNPQLPEAKLRQLADGDYIDRADNVLFIGEPGTGKTHLAIALGVAAAHQGRRVKFATTARLVNELCEARDALQLSRVVKRYATAELLILDELGYVPLSKADAELLFQVISERAEQGALIVTTNLPFSEWTSVFLDPRLCKAVIDRLTHRSVIVDTGRTSIRLEEALQRQVSGVPTGRAAVEGEADDGST